MSSRSRPATQLERSGASIEEVLGTLGLRKLAAGVLIVFVIASLSVAYYLYEQPKPVMIVISGVTLNVELAETAADQQRGLSGRDSMPLDHGMLFIFDYESNWSFWMYGMKFPLDIIWFDSGRRAVFIQQDLQPCAPAECPIHTPPITAMYVLEVNAGFVITRHLALGDTFAFI